MLCAWFIATVVPQGKLYLARSHKPTISLCRKVMKIIFIWSGQNLSNRTACYNLEYMNLFMHGRKTGKFDVLGKE